MLKIPCSKEEKKGLENCHKSQSFFNGINLMQAAPGGEKTQTLSTNQSRVSPNISDNTYSLCQQKLLLLFVVFKARQVNISIDWVGLKFIKELVNMAELLKKTSISKT